jgi:hypothetical protein
MGITTETDELGIKYYIVPTGFELYKATKFNLAPKYDSQPKQITLETGSYFFGLPAPYDKGTEEYETYIESYEDTYGVIYNFKTQHEFKLLALDDYNTLKYLYDDTAVYDIETAKNVRAVLTINYGYNPNAYELGTRNSNPNDDNILVEYLKTKGIGYAIFNMNTDFGKFHPELFFYNITPDDIVCTGIVTEPVRYKTVEENIRMRALGEQQRNDRKKRKVFESANDENVLNFNLALNDGTHSPPVSKFSYDSPVKKQATEFSYDSPVSKFSFDSPVSKGGKKKRTTKSKKTRKSRKSRKSRTRK